MKKIDKQYMEVMEARKTARAYMEAIKGFSYSDFVRDWLNEH